MRVLYRDDRYQLEADGLHPPEADLVLRGRCVVCQQVLHERHWSPPFTEALVRRALVQAQARIDAGLDLAHVCLRREGAAGLGASCQKEVP